MLAAILVTMGLDPNLYVSWVCARSLGDPYLDCVFRMEGAPPNGRAAP